jgi:transcriptional regulator of acetoin/glycerol metabolism
MKAIKRDVRSTPIAARNSGEAIRDPESLMSGSMPPVIAMSWQRCRGFGLDSTRHSEFDVMDECVLANQREKNHLLLMHAQPVMDVLFEQIVDTQNVLVLSNDTGYILHSCGDPCFLKQAEKIALAPGADWSEANRGTNAIGTALTTGAPVAVNGDQHFLSENHFLTCSASPINDPYGGLVGILDITGDLRSFNQHTMALVRMSVRMIENKMFASAFCEVLVLRFHARPEFVGTLCEGMMAFNEEGSLLSANGNACFQFGQTLEQLRDCSFASLFGQPISRLFDYLMARPHDPIPFTLNNGIRVHARADFRPGHLRQHFRHATQSDVSMPTPFAATSAAAEGAHRSPAKSTSCPLERLRTGDPKFDAVVEKVKKVVDRDIPILILGETGTGKELLANAVHRASPRAAKPFVAVNCAAIPEGLIESELFGYEEGAFTGARRKGNIGRIAQACGGTLFLDEIGDMPASLQGRLLRVLQERVVVPLGSMKSYPVDIAVICATHQQIRELVSSGKFREDLYFRINGLTVSLPPLRTRTDFDALVDVLLLQLGGPEAPTLHPEVRDLFHRHPWPGNLRQLSYLLRTALVMAEGGPTILREHLPDDFIEDMQHRSLAPNFQKAAVERRVGPTIAPPPTPASANMTIGASAGRLQDFALQAIQNSISRNYGNISAAARELGISRCTLYRKLKA